MRQSTETDFRPTRPAVQLFTFAVRIYRSNRSLLDSAAFNNWGDRGLREPLPRELDLHALSAFSSGCPAPCITQAHRNGPKRSVPKTMHRFTTAVSCSRPSLLTPMEVASPRASSSIDAVDSDLYSDYPSPL
jgi:hypothetical protein